MSIEHLLEMQKQLMEVIPHEHKIKDEHQGTIVAAVGLVEEVMEYLNAIGFKSWRPNPLSREAQLEELTDIWFFVLELVILSGFSWEEIKQEYYRKHTENLERYRRAKEGDYGWDNRGKGEL